LEAEKYFQKMHAQQPEDSRATYYLAITQAQLGRFQKAKALYQEVLALDPNSESAKLAQEGLLYLPAETNLDSPPKFQKSIVTEQDKSIPENRASMPASVVTPGMSPQDMMAWQMMMSQMGGNQQQQQGGMNPLMYMMPQMTGDPNAPKIDPGVMSNMLMNQMMQNFSLDGNKQDNQ
jgi:tetratricopeptide (TPR) repeat protein